MDPVKEFEQEVAANVDRLAEDADLQALSRIWVRETQPHRYTYNFRWMGLPIIQFPQDIVALQEIIWDTRPDLIIETGVARGGSLVFYSSQLAALGDDAEREVVGIDVDIRAHNRRALEEHPAFDRIRLIEGSSVSSEVVEQVRGHVERHQRVMVVLDSNHTHEHVRDELELYSPFVTRGCYLVVLDTLIDDMPADFFPERPWGVGNNPKTAVHDFLTTAGGRFEIDKRLDHKLLISVAPDGFLRRVG